MKILIKYDNVCEDRKGNLIFTGSALHELDKSEGRKWSIAGIKV